MFLATHGFLQTYGHDRGKKSWKLGFLFVIIFRQRTHSVDQAGPELTETCVYLLSTEIKGVCHHTRVIMFWQQAVYPMLRVTGSWSFYDPCAAGKCSATEPHSQGLTKLAKLALNLVQIPFGSPVGPGMFLSLFRKENITMPSFPSPRHLGTGPSLVIGSLQMQYEWSANWSKTARSCYPYDRRGHRSQGDRERPHDSGGRA